MKSKAILLKGGFLSAFVLAALAANLVFSGQAFAERVQARPAFRFVDSVGVVTHFSWGFSPYGTQYARAKGALAELGIRHIRDQAGNAQALGLFRDLNRSLGVRMVLGVDMRRGGGAGERLEARDIPGKLAELREHLGRQALTAIEGPNEYNILERDYGYRGWPEELRAYQAELYRQVRNDRELDSTPVLAPPLGGPNIPYYHDVLGNISRIADEGSAHIYPNWMSMAQKVEEIFPAVKIAHPRERIWITEGGWHDAVNSGRMFVPEDTMIRYLPRAMAEFATHPDITRGYFYQLIDPVPDPSRSDTTAHFGLMDTRLSKKPSFYATRNLMHVMCDDRPVRDTGSLSYNLSGNLSDVRSHLYQKRNGVFYLLIWVEKQLHDRFGRIENRPQAVSVRFGEPISLVRRYAPSDPNSDLTRGNLPERVYSAPEEIDLNVPDHMMVLEIVPRGTAVPAVSTSCDFTP
jgi:hypothetical protein